MIKEIKEDSTNNESEKVKSTLYQKYGPPGVKTPGDIDTLLNSKSPVSTGVKIPEFSQSKEEAKTQQK